MKLPIVEAIATAPTGKVVPLTKHTSYLISHETAMDDIITNRAFEIRSSATFEIRQLSRDTRETKYLDVQAKRVMIHEIYGPVSERLHEILHMLYEEGPMYNNKVALSIESLIGDLRL